MVKLTLICSALTLIPRKTSLPCFSPLEPPGFLLVEFLERHPISPLHTVGHCLVILFHISPFHTGINRLGVDTEYYSILLNSSIDDHLGAYVDHWVLTTSIEHGNMMIAIQGNISSGGLPL